MVYVRKKVINGKEYFYEQECKRDNGCVKTKHVRYVGTNADSHGGSGSSTPQTKEDKLIQPFTKDTWSESEVNLALRRINAGKIKTKDIFDKNKSLYDGDGVTLTQEQSQKGFKYLRNLHYTPSGKEKQSSPYGSREVAIIDNPREIKLVDFYSERGRYYVPLYRAINKDGDSMDYYVSGGRISIVG